VKAHHSRLLALRLACLGEADREWVYSQLSPAEALRVQGLLSELRQSGLLRDPAVLRQVLAETTAAVADAEDGDAVMAAALSGLDKPVWQAIALQYLEPAAKAAAEERFLAGNPLLQRQLRDSFSGLAVPPGWKSVLIRQAPAAVRPAPLKEV
jgi:hypothetical protein